MSHQLHNSLTRILAANGSPVGVGFLSAENLILICAHVIEQAIGQEEIMGEPQNYIEHFKVEFERNIRTKK